MKLLHTEIDVVPGRKPQKQPLPEGYVGAGTAILRLTNTSSRQNAYTIRIQCAEPYWQDAWYQLSALPPSGGPENQPPAGKPDQLGPRNQTITLYVQDGGSRDVFMSFFVPEKSECRAGAYPVKVIVETRIVSDDPQLARQERITEIPATVIVRPFYKWTVAFTPEDRKVGFFKRGKEFELVVDNQSNDWLYCDLKMPRPQNVLVETPTSRLAVPPPEPGADSIRTVPVKGISRIRTVRGNPQPFPLPVSIQRVDAPTVPALPEEATYGPSGANIKAAVVQQETQDVATPEVQPTLTYCPLIPATFVGFFQALIRNAKALVLMLVGLVIAWNLAYFTWEYFFRSISTVTVLRTQVSAGGKLEIRGKNLAGSKIIIFDESGKNPIGEPIEPKYSGETLTMQKVAIIVPKELDGQRIKIGAQRLGKFTFLASFLPINKDPAVVQVGKVKIVKGAAAGSISQTVAPGKPLVIGGANFGDEKGRVLLNGNQAVITTWTDTKVVVKVPQNLQNGEPITVLMFDPGNNPMSVSPNQFVVMEQAPAGDPNNPGGDIPIPPDMGGTNAGGSSGGFGDQQDPGGAGSSGGVAGTSGGGGGTSGGGTGGGEAGVQTPAGYGDLLADSRSSYATAVSKARGTSGGVLAVKAYALASMNKLDEAKAALVKANAAIGSKSQGVDVAMFYIAQARVVEKLNPDNGDQAYAIADEKANAAAPGFPFTDIAIARYKISQGKWSEANALLQNASRGNLTPGENAAVQKLMQQVQRQSR